MIGLLPPMLLMLLLVLLLADEWMMKVVGFDEMS
jgi:hypothetical protein